VEIPPGTSWSSGSGIDHRGRAHRPDDSLLTSHWTWAPGLALVVVSLTWALLEWIRSVSDPQSAGGRARRISVIPKARLLRSGRFTGVRLWAVDADVAVTQNVGTAQNVHITGVDADAAP